MVEATRIYFVRHGESEWNIINKVQGQKNSLLTENGKLQAVKLAKRLKNHDIDIIYSSDLTRAYETALTIANEKNMTPIKNSNLQEMNFGIWEGELFSDILVEHKEDYLKWVKSPESLEIPKGETIHDLENRVGSEVRKIINVNKGKNILIVSHGTALKTMILSLLNTSLNNYKNLAMGNVSLSIVEVRDYNNVLITYNDTSHLEGDLNE